MFAQGLASTVPSSFDRMNELELRELYDEIREETQDERSTHDVPVEEIREILKKLCISKRPNFKE